MLSVIVLLIKTFVITDETFSYLLTKYLLLLTKHSVITNKKFNYKRSVIIDKRSVLTNLNKRTDSTYKLNARNVRGVIGFQKKKRKSLTRIWAVRQKKKACGREGQLLHADMHGGRPDRRTGTGPGERTGRLVGRSGVRCR
jgi:hypothetical protein